MLTRYVALLTAVSTEHSFVGLCSILLLHRKRTAPTANTVHLLALCAPFQWALLWGFGLIAHLEEEVAVPPIQKQFITESVSG